MFLFALVVEELGHFVVGFIKGFFSLSGFLLQFLCLIRGSAISRVMIGSFQVARGVPRFLDLM